MTLAAAPYGHAATHGTMFSLVWFVNEINGDNLPDNRRDLLMGQALYQITYCISTICHYLDGKFSLNMRAEIAGISGRSR